MTAECGRNGKCYLNSSIHSVGLVTLDLFPLSFFGMLYLTPSRFYARLTLASVTILCATGSTSASSDAPSSFEFRRRSDHGSVVVGDFVYIEGGRIRSLNHNNDARAPVNKTLAIDLRQSWTNETVQFIETTKGNSPALTYPSLWPDGNGSFYMWAGAAATSARIPALGLWEFTTDASGSGEWLQQSPRNATEFNQLTRPVAGYSGVVAGAGFYLGGQGTTYTDDVDTHAPVPVPGLVSYNFTTRACRSARAGCSSRWAARRAAGRRRRARSGSSTSASSTCMSRRRRPGTSRLPRETCPVRALPFAWSARRGGMEAMSSSCLAAPAGTMGRRTGTFTCCLCRRFAGSGGRMRMLLGSFIRARLLGTASSCRLAVSTTTTTLRHAIRVLILGSKGSVYLI